MQERKNQNNSEFYMRSIVHTMKQIQDARLSAYDITNQQARLLGCIQELLQKENVWRQKDLEKIMELRGSSITSLLQGLEKKGFITRSYGALDSRTKQPVLTEKAERLLLEMNRVFADTNACMVRNLTDAEQVLLERLLRIVYDNVTSVY